VLNGAEKTPHSTAPVKDDVFRIWPASWAPFVVTTSLARNEADHRPPEEFDRERSGVVRLLHFDSKEQEEKDAEQAVEENKQFHEAGLVHTFNLHERMQIGVANLIADQVGRPRPDVVCDVYANPKIGERGKSVGLKKGASRDTGLDFEE
jgi:hypothetical protein